MASPEPPAGRAGSRVYGSSSSGKAMAYDSCPVKGESLEIPIGWLRRSGALGAISEKDLEYVEQNDGDEIDDCEVLSPVLSPGQRRSVTSVGTGDNAERDLAAWTATVARKLQNEASGMEGGSDALRRSSLVKAAAAANASALHGSGGGHSTEDGVGSGSVSSSLNSSHIGSDQLSTKASASSSNESSKTNLAAGDGDTLAIPDDPALRKYLATRRHTIASHTHVPFELPTPLMVGNENRSRRGSRSSKSGLGPNDSSEVRLSRVQFSHVEVAGETVRLPVETAQFRRRNSLNGPVRGPKVKFDLTGLEKEFGGERKTYESSQFDGSVVDTSSQAPIPAGRPRRFSVCGTETGSILSSMLADIPARSVAESLARFEQATNSEPDATPNTTSRLTRRVTLSHPPGKAANDVDSVAALLVPSSVPLAQPRSTTSLQIPHPPTSSVTTAGPVLNSAADLNLKVFLNFETLDDYTAKLGFTPGAILNGHAAADQPGTSPTCTGASSPAQPMSRRGSLIPGERIAMPFSASRSGPNTAQGSNASSADRIPIGSGDMSRNMTSSRPTSSSRLSSSSGGFLGEDVSCFREEADLAFKQLLAQKNLRGNHSPSSGPSDTVDTANHRGAKGNGTGTDSRRASDEGPRERSSATSPARPTHAHNYSKRNSWGPGYRHEEAAECESSSVEGDKVGLSKDKKPKVRVKEWLEKMFKPKGTR
ncbi:hypothetical protein HDU96_005409 [Phlyctochytrium bullatum]|nr:hypothetical protein HDU96_005409 [Phlyctochytrium bullatum]